MINILNLMSSAGSTPEVTPRGSSIKKYKKAHISVILRTQVWDRWVGIKKGQITCPYCKVHKISQLDFECGHLVSERHGGTTDVYNLRPVCQKCNKSFGARNMPDLYKRKFPFCCF